MVNVSPAVSSPNVVHLPASAVAVNVPLLTSMLSSFVAVTAPPSMLTVPLYSVELLAVASIVKASPV